MVIDHLWREILLLLLIWQLIESVGRWQEVRKYEHQGQKRRTKGKKRRQRRPEAFEGPTKKPECELCEAAESQARPLIPQPPAKIEQKRGRPRQVDTAWQHCPNDKCAYHGWLGLGNICSNGRPNGGPWRQLRCLVCQSYFLETHGTIFYGKRRVAQLMLRAMLTIAEGLGVRAVGRVFEVEPETVLAWLMAGAQQIELFSSYQLRQLQVEQIQMDELYGRIRAVSAGEGDQAERRSTAWLWTAMDPVSKLWLALIVGPRTLGAAQSLVHQVAQRLASGCLPTFITDGLADYQTALLTHFGAWQPRQNSQGRRLKPRWMPLPGLDYAQVIKKRRRRRLVGVRQRVVFGSLERIKTQLAAHGWHISTAFIERLNLSIRQHVSGLGRRVMRLSQSMSSLRQQALLYQAYYNFCLPHTSLRQPLPQPRPTKGTGSMKVWQPCTPAMAAGLTDRVWTLREVLLFRVPPWPQEAAA